MLKGRLWVLLREKGATPHPCPFLCSQWWSHIEIFENFFSKLRIVYMCVCVCMCPHVCPALALFSAPNGRVTLKFLKTFFQNIELCICVCVLKNLILPPKMTFQRKTNKYWLIELVSLKNTKEIYPS